MRFLPAPGALAPRTPAPGLRQRPQPDRRRTGLLHTRTKSTLRDANGKADVYEWDETGRRAADLGRDGAGSRQSGRRAPTAPTPSSSRRTRSRRGRERSGREDLRRSGVWRLPDDPPPALSARPRTSATAPVRRRPPPPNINSQTGTEEPDTAKSAKPKCRKGFVRRGNKCKKRRHKKATQARQEQARQEEERQQAHE